MIDTKDLRRLAQEATPGPWKMLPVGDGRQKFAVADSEFLSILTVTDEGDVTFGTVYDDADARFIAAANPATVSELLDRLEEAEADALEQARLNGMGASREATLMAKLEAAEKSDAESIAMYRKARDERDELRAKIEEMEKQKPVGTVHDDGYFVFSAQRPYEGNYAGWKMKLYALPGAQPAPSISPVALCHVIQWLRNGCDPMKAADELEMLAAATEAKPCP